MIGATITTQARALEQWASVLPNALQAACTVEAQAIQDEFEQQAPKDTRSLSLSVYVTTADGYSDYSVRTSAADSVNPAVAILPELPAPPAPGARVAVAASHGQFVEFGTVRMGARPVFIPSVERARQRFPRTVAALLGAP